MNGTSGFVLTGEPPTHAQAEQLVLVLDAYYSRRLRRHLLMDSRGKLIAASPTAADLINIARERGATKISIADSDGRRTGSDLNIAAFEEK